MTTYDLFRALTTSVQAFESKLHFEALASVARENVTGVAVEAVRASAVLLAANPIVKDAESRARAAHVASFCTTRGIATMDVREMLGALAHMHVLAARAVISSMPRLLAARAVISSMPGLHEEEVRRKLAATADGLLRDATYLMMGDAIADALAATPPSEHEEPAPISGLRSSVVP
jgi:hypothetical protein